WRSIQIIPLWKAIMTIMSLKLKSRSIATISFVRPWTNAMWQENVTMFWAVQRQRNILAMNAIWQRGNVWTAQEAMKIPPLQIAPPPIHHELYGRGSWRWERCPLCHWLDWFGRNVCTHLFCFLFVFCFSFQEDEGNVPVEPNDAGEGNEPVEPNDAGEGNEP